MKDMINYDKALDMLNQLVCLRNEARSTLYLIIMDYFEKGKKLNIRTAHNELLKRKIPLSYKNTTLHIVALEKEGIIYNKGKRKGAGISKELLPTEKGQKMLMFLTTMKETFF